jgi:hypothetical protein
LHVERGVKSLAGTRELREKPVSGKIQNVAAVLVNLLHDGGEIPADALVGCGFV